MPAASMSEMPSTPSHPHTHSVRRRAGQSLMAAIVTAGLVAGLASCGNNDEDMTPVTVTEVTSTTVGSGGKSSSATSDTNGEDIDFSQLSMDPKTDPRSAGYFKELRRQGIKTRDMEQALLSMGYSYCYAKNDPKSEQMMTVMAETLARMQGNVSSAKIEKSVKKAAVKKLCTR